MGVGIADPHNQAALATLAAAFNACYQPLASAAAIPALRAEYSTILALDTGPGAGDLYRYRLPPAGRVALLLGNERRGLGHTARCAADALLAIPMREGGALSLNVAGAAAIGLSQLAAGAGRVGGGAGGRPAVLFAAPTDPAQLGSSLRAAWALGWPRVWVADSQASWWPRDRATFAAGRGAARRHKIPLQVLPYAPPAQPAYDLAVVITREGPGPSLWATRFPLGSRTLVVLPDERAPPAAWPALAPAARRVQRLTLALPARAAPYDYRLLTTLVLGELARRAG